MSARLVSFVCEESGNTVQEYALIAAILAVVIPTAISLIGDDLVSALRAVVNGLEFGDSKQPFH